MRLRACKLRVATESLVFTRRRQARTSEQVVPSFAPVQIAATEAEETPKLFPVGDGRGRSVAAARIGFIEIDLGNRRRIRVDTHVDPEVLARVLEAPAKSEATVGRLEIERLKLMPAKARRGQLGQSSERGKLLVVQLELAIEDLEKTQDEQETEAEIAAPGAAKEKRTQDPRSPRQPLRSLLATSSASYATRHWPFKTHL
jgi:hypothetical protein